MRKTPSQVSRCQWFKILGVRWDDIQQRPNGKDVSGATWLANCEQLTASLSRISRKLLARAKRKVCKTVNLGCNSSFCVCMCDWWDSALYHRVLAFSFLFFSFSSHPIIPTTAPPPPHLFTSYYRIKCGAQFGSGSTGHLVHCVCMRACLFVLVFLDVDSRLGRTAHKQSCSAAILIWKVFTRPHRARWRFIDHFQDGST